MDGSLLEPEFQPHFDAWRADPSPQKAQTLLQATKPIIDSAVRSYGGTNPSPTLNSRAKLLALDAFTRYDPMRAKLRTHMMVHLQGLRRHAAREQQVIPLPERVGLDLFRLNQYENELRDKFNRDPSDMELSQHSGLSLKRIGYIRQAKPSYAEGTIAASTLGDDDQGGFSPAVLGVGDSGHWNEFVYHDLDPSDQVIMEHTLGMHGKRVLPKQEIARRLGISPGAVSQRAARIQEKLNQREDVSLF